jgi:hypothetical protein
MSEPSSNPWTIRLGEDNVWIAKCGPNGPTKDSDDYFKFWCQALRVARDELNVVISKSNPLFNLNWMNLPFPDHAKERLDILTWLADVDRDATVANGDTVESVYYQQLHVYWSMSEKQREEHGNLVPLSRYRDACLVDLVFDLTTEED